MPKPKYHSYLIRLWQDDSGGKSPWRFVLVNLIEGERWGFASLEELIAFLKDQVDALSSSDSVVQSDKAQQHVDSDAALLFE